MPDKVNPRTERARTALLNAAFELVSAKPVNEISLTEIAEKANVSRPTVYKHFTDTPSLVARTAEHYLDICFEKVDQAVATGDDRKYLRRVMRVLTSMLYERADFTKNALTGPSSSEISAYAISLIADRMRSRFIGSRIPITGQEAEDEINGMAAGMFWLIVNWLQTDFKGVNSIDNMADRLADVMFRFSGASDSEQVDTF